jgi:uncharacterized membrane protein YdjX (TVP38/TMEM64 family)
VGRLRESDVADRIRILSPEVTDGTRTEETTVHSKVMVVDDRLLRIGSANLNNRSMGTDTECDLVIEVSGGSAEIVRIRDRLIADHCGVSADEVAAAIGRSGSLVHTVESLSGNGHRLRPAHDNGAASPQPIISIDALADPVEPLGAEEFMGAMLGERPYRFRAAKLLRLGLFVGVFVLLSLAWLYTPLHRFADTTLVQGLLNDLAGSQLAPILVIGAFVVLGLVAFPLTLLIAATAAAFGPMLGFAYAALGALSSAALTYAVGAMLGRAVLHDVLGHRMQRLRGVLQRQGVLAVAGIRLVPIAPFAVVNAAAGALRVRFSDFMGGTVIGLAPGLLLMSALGHQIAQIVARPTWRDVALLAAGVIVWIAVAVAAQMVVSRYRRSAQ